MSDSHTNFDANSFSRGAAVAVFAGASAVADAICAERDRMQSVADDAATDAALASWERLVEQLSHENVLIRTALDERDTDIVLLEAQLASCRQRMADAGLA